jgi:hypothetical protein
MTDIRALIADDAFAASFQSLGQYRTALLAALAQPEPQVPTDEELDGLFDAHCYTDDFGTHLMDAACFRDGARAALAQPEPQGPSDSLVDRVADALMESIKGQAPMARAAIHEVAAWLRDHYGGPTASSTALEQEAER